MLARRSDMRYLLGRGAGDTIVEVLIAIVVVSMILAGAFVVVNTSLRGERDAQEHSQAVKVTESQLEMLRAAVLADTSIPATDFCMHTSGPVSFSASACTFNQSNALAASGEQPAYTITISKSSETYKVQADWDSVTGGRAREIMYYKVYAP